MLKPERKDIEGPRFNPKGDFAGEAGDNPAPEPTETDKEEVQDEE